MSPGNPKIFRKLARNFGDIEAKPAVFRLVLAGGAGIYAPIPARHFELEYSNITR
jgi:hypothetical protein